MKAAVIGAGRMGRTHIQAVRDLGLELAGVCDHSTEALAFAGEELDIPKDRCFTDAAQLLERTHPECVVVATTAPSHSQYTRLAAEAGARYILCEKPIAVSLAQADAMIEMCKSTGARLAVNHQMRFMEQYTQAKQTVWSEEFGGLSSVAVMAGNFGMAMNGSHYFEMFRYMTGEAPREVTAWFSEELVRNPRGAEFEDRAGSLRMTTPSGRRLYMEIGADQGHGVKVIYSGPYGQLVVDELAGKMYLGVRQREDRRLPTHRYGMPSQETVRSIEPAGNLGPTRAVLEALIQGGEAPTGEDARLALRALVGAYVSHERGHVCVPLDDSALPLDRVFPWA